MGGTLTPTVTNDNNRNSVTIDPSYIASDTTGDELIWDGHDARLPNLLDQWTKYASRNHPDWDSIATDNTFSSRGKIYIDHPDSSVFYEKLVTEPGEPYSFFNPCPPTPIRTAEYDRVPDTPKFDPIDEDGPQRQEARDGGTRRQRGEDSSSPAARSRVGHRTDVAMRATHS